MRFPDPSANPYLAFAAMLMAGLDGIQNKIHPGDPMDKNLYDLPPEELSKVPTVAGSLREALNCLDADRTFLTKGGVFTDDQIDAYMELKWEEVYAWEHQPAPIEYKMYYSIWFRRQFTSGRPPFSGGLFFGEAVANPRRRIQTDRELQRGSA